PAQRREHRIRTLALEDRLQRPRLERLDVRARRELRIGHDRRRIRVDEDDLVTLLLERLRALCAGIVELAGLPDDDWPCADDENLFEVVATRQSFLPAAFLAGVRFGRKGALIAP